MPRIVGGVEKAVGNLLLFAERNAAELLEGSLGVFLRVERSHRPVVAADGFAMLAAAVYEFRVLFLQERRIGEHRQAQIDGGGRGVDRALKSVLDQARQIAAVVDVRVREDDGVDRGRRKRKLAVARERLLAASLIETTVEQILPAAGLDMMHRPGDGLVGAPESEFHDFEYNHNYTMRKARPLS